MSVTCSILTPPTATGAIAVIELLAKDADELDRALEWLHIGQLPPGRAALRDLLGVDRGIAARWTGTTCHLMAHGGVGIVRKLLSRLTEMGLREATPGEFPEASSELEAKVLAALSRAASPLAIDLLLEQPRRWKSGLSNDDALDRVLDRLIEPPLIVAIGAPNVGKSTLANALAGRSVAIVADEPGTTRDHVGVGLDLAGLTVRYFDTPGLRHSADEIEREAREISLHSAASADLVVLLGDAIAPPPELCFAAPTVRVALRSDLGAAPWPADVRVCARTGDGIAALVGTLRERLVPITALRDPRPWRFWKGPAAPVQGAVGQE